MKTYHKIILLGAVSLVLVLVSLSLGTMIMSPADMARVFFGDSGGAAGTILLRLRLPRVLLAMVIGASLGVSGVVFQSVLKNPLADPYIIGVSGGAALGATAGIIMNAGPYLVAVAAFAGSIIAISAVYLLSKRMNLGSSALILSGIAIGFILSAGVLLMYALSRSDQMHRAMLWLMGDLSAARYDMLNVLGGVTFLFIAAIMAFHKHLDIVSLGDRFSKNLGVTTGNIRALFWLASFLAAISVSLAGVIGFVGLMVPHLMRGIFGPRHFRLVPASAAGGALFLLASDTIGRSIIPPFEIPVGVITGFLGGAFFLIFMIRREGGRP